MLVSFFFFSSRRRHTRCALVTGVQTCALPILHAAAQLLVGHHDFTSFRSSECQAKSPEKTLDLLSVTRVGEAIEVRAEARSFLHHQVRNFVGSLKLVGEGRWTAENLRLALQARDRAAAGPTAPACGLYLTEVGYPPV